MEEEWVDGKGKGGWRTNGWSGKGNVVGEVKGGWGMVRVCWRIVSFRPSVFSYVPFIFVLSVAREPS